MFESSWEVCNKVGGIYTVLSTRAKVLSAKLADHVVFIGPRFSSSLSSGDFVCDDQLFSAWRSEALSEGLDVLIGRWQVPGSPIVILVDFTPFYEKKNDIYSHLWNDYQVDSLHAYGDYDEASMFSYAAGRVVESFYRFYLDDTSNVIYHCNEWMTGLGLLYVRKHLPQVATVFTTHATSIGRSIAGNGKPLYDYLPAYNGDQMASELNMQSKHSIEKKTAMNADCFTTVSDITAIECAQLLDKPVDVVLPNGFEDDFVPTGARFTASRRNARKQLLRMANALTGKTFPDDTLIVSTSGRYEFRNKGIDVFIESVSRLRGHDLGGRKVLALIEVPGWVCCPREDLQQRMQSTETSFDTPLEKPYITHWLHNQDVDQVTTMSGNLGFDNVADQQVTLIFVPSYLVGNDGILNMPYYDLIAGNDLTVYPSYYEPWGYTPLESVAFHVPCVTTDLSGFGLWVNKEIGHVGQIADGVKVVYRTDYNYSEVADEIKLTILDFIAMTPSEVKQSRDKAFRLSKHALWSKFIRYYSEAYRQALASRDNRLNTKTI